MKIPILLHMKCKYYYYYYKLLLIRGTTTAGNVSLGCLSEKCLSEKWEDNSCLLEYDQKVNERAGATIFSAICP